MSAYRISVPGQPVRLVDQLGQPVRLGDMADPELRLTPRQREVLTVVRSFNGNRSRAARYLGVTVQSVQEHLRLVERAGVRVPSGATRRGRPDLKPRERTR